MPGFNGMGPNGLGPRTGRGMGRCGWGMGGGRGYRRGCSYNQAPINQEEEKEMLTRDLEAIQARIKELGSKK